jgi:hypothetical protein
MRRLTKKDWRDVFLFIVCLFLIGYSCKATVDGICEYVDSLEQRIHKFECMECQMEELLYRIHCPAADFSKCFNGESALTANVQKER